MSADVDAKASATEPSGESRSAAREARAERYFDHDLAGQRRWYAERATQFKARTQALGVTVIAAGAGTTLLQVFGGERWVAMGTAMLGALVALAEGWRQIARYDEAWSSYRQASERMKRERRLYANGAGDYRGLLDEEEAFIRFVEAVEAIVVEEQQIFWKGSGERVDRGRTATADRTAAPPRGDAGRPL